MARIVASTEDAIRILTISNEKKRNAFTSGMQADLLRHLTDVDNDPQVRAVVITGSGQNAFSSGHDIGSLENTNGLDDSHDLKAYLKPLEMAVPVIAAVNGYCFGAGLILALSCDFRIGSENASFGSPGARLGMLPEGGQLIRLPLLMSRGAAMEFMLSAEPLSASDGYQAGLLNRITKTGEVLKEAMNVASKIARNSPRAVEAIKRAILLGERDGYQGALAYEVQAAKELMLGPDAQEGVQSFLEKREPEFGNR